jgi:hypothetical protein
VSYLDIEKGMGEQLTVLSEFVVVINKRRKRTISLR